MLDTRAVRHFASFRERRRRRELAGDARAGSWARGRAHLEQRAFVRENWIRFALFLLAGFLVCLGVSWTMPNDLLRGVVIGAFLVALPSAVWVLTMQFTGTAPVMMGDEAEQWTAAELRRLSRRGWRVINHVALREDDIDHVLVGPGGAYAVETKWSSSWSTSYGRDRVLEGIEQVRANARLLKLWHPLKQLGITPQPVVVMWGPGLSKVNPQDRVRVVNDVTVVVGPALRAWLSSLGSGVLSEQQTSDAWSVLARGTPRRSRPCGQHAAPATYLCDGGSSQTGAGGRVCCLWDRGLGSNRLFDFERGEPVKKGSRPYASMGVA